MRIRKIRGHRRKWREIEKWTQNNKTLNEDFLNKYHNDYAEIIVHPWCDLSLTNSRLPELKGKTKKLILNGLIEIYNEWKKQLEQLNQDYYLKIWLFEPRFSKSQVVCGIKERIDFYNNNFYKPDNNYKPKKINYINHISFQDFNWSLCFDEFYFDKSDLGTPDEYDSLGEYNENKIWYDNLFKKPYRTTKFKEPIGSITESYAFKQGYILVGGKTKHEP